MSDGLITGVVTSEVELLATEAKVEVLKVVDAVDDFVGTHIVAPVEAVVEKVEDTIEGATEKAVGVVREFFQYDAMEVDKIVAEATQIEHVVVTEVHQVVEEAKEGLVAAENVARRILNHTISAGGGSVIKNPA